MRPNNHPTLPFMTPLIAPAAGPSVVSTSILTSTSASSTTTSSAAALLFTSPSSQHLFSQQPSFQTPRNALFTPPHQMHSLHDRKNRNINHIDFSTLRPPLLHPGFVPYQPVRLVNLEKLPRAKKSSSPKTTGKSRINVPPTCAVIIGKRSSKTSSGSHNKSNNNKAQAVRPGPLNNGFDDINNDYIIVIGEVWDQRYTITQRLGRGSFGQVVEAFDKVTKQRVAIKIIKNRTAFYKQALVEERVLKFISDTNATEECHIVQMYRSFRHQSHLCLVYEILGLNLYELLRCTRFHGLSLTIVRDMAAQLLKCLEFLSRDTHRIVHCDLKPENILIADPNTNRIKVIDFGSSTYENEQIYTYIQSRFYRAPEIMFGLDYGCGIDTWSLGCVLIELLTGEPLFPGKTESEMLAGIQAVIGMPPRHILNLACRYYVPNRYGTHPKFGSKKDKVMECFKRFEETRSVEDGGVGSDVEDEATFYSNMLYEGEGVGSSSGSSGSCGSSEDEDDDDAMDRDGDSCDEDYDNAVHYSEEDDDDDGDDGEDVEGGKVETHCADVDDDENDGHYPELEKSKWNEYENDEDEENDDDTPTTFTEHVEINDEEASDYDYGEDGEPYDYEDEDDEVDARTPCLALVKKRCIWKCVAPLPTNFANGSAWGGETRHLWDILLQQFMKKSMLAPMMEARLTYTSGCRKNNEDTDEKDEEDDGDDYDNPQFDKTADFLKSVETRSIAIQTDEPTHLFEQQGISDAISTSKYSLKNDRLITEASDATPGETLTDYKRFLNLVYSMLQYDPVDRITPEEAMEHRFFVTCNSKGVNTVLSSVFSDGPGETFSTPRS